MLKATVISLLITVGAMLFYCIGNIVLNTWGKQSQIGLGAFMAWTVLDPLLWYFAVTVFFFTFSHINPHRS